MTQPFYFPDGRLANNADDLFELSQQYPDDATNYLVRGDLENWLAYIGSYELAECATNARQAELEDRQKLEEFLNRFSSITSAQAVPAAVTETPIDNDSTVVEPTPTMEAAEESETSTGASLPMAATVTDTTEVPPQEETSVATTTATPPEKSAESLRSSSGEDSQPQSASSPEAGSPEEKPSFFQVVAKFIVKILYRNKA